MPNISLNSDFFAPFHFIPHIDFACGIFATGNDSQYRINIARFKYVASSLEVKANLIGQSLSVHLNSHYKFTHPFLNSKTNLHLHLRQDKRSDAQKFQKQILEFYAIYHKSVS